MVNRNTRFVGVMNCIFWLISVATGAEYCVDDTFKAECQDNQVIIMTNATWGRMSVGRCITINSHIGCSTDVLHVVDPWCSGKSKCEFPILNSELRASTPCLKELQTFLIAEYQCITVTELQKTQCSTDTNNDSQLTQGYLNGDANICGSPSKPWRIAAKPGQWISLHIYDFSQTGSDTRCEPLGFVQEAIVRNNITICSGNNKRGDLIYSSVGPSVLITKSASHHGDKRKTFVLKFQIHGCPDPEIMGHIWYKRDGTRAQLGCKEEDIEWTIQCKDGSWIGQHKNCTAQGRDSAEPSNKHTEGTAKLSTLPDKTWMVIIISLAVFVSFVVFLFGFVYIMRRRQSQKDSATSFLQPLTQETIYKHNKEYAFMNDVPANPSYQTSNKSQAKPYPGSTLQPVVHASTCRRAQNKFASSTSGWSDSLPHASYSNRGDIHQNTPVDGILLNQNTVSANSSEYEIPYGSRHIDSNVYNGMIPAEMPTTKNN